jgi:RND family efflux transporter MFP subunit
MRMNTESGKQPAVFGAFVRFFVAIGLTTVYLAACAAEKQEPEEIIRPVRYQKVYLSSGVQTRTFSGTSKAGTEVNLSFRVGGIVNTIPVNVGDRVREGQLIASIDDSDARLKTEQASGALEKSRIQLDIARSNLDRVKGLYENNNVSLSEYEAAKGNYAAANAAYNADKRSLDLQRRQLSYYTLYAPIDGIIARKEIEENENVQTGKVVVVINASDEIEVSVGVPEAFVSRVQAGERVSVTFSSLAGQVFDGVISEVSYAISNASSTYPVTVSLILPTQDIRPGMPAEVSFDFVSDSQTEGILVPPNAVGEDTKGNFAFTVEETGDGFAVVKRKVVAVGRLTRDGFEIQSGLEDGDLVVTAGLSKLTDGMKVRLLK